MSQSTSSRFIPQNQTTHERLSTNTVGLVALSDFRKRRAEVLEQQEKEAREAALRVGSRSSRTESPASASADGVDGDSDAKNKKRKTKPCKPGKRKALISFSVDEEEQEEEVEKKEHSPNYSGNNEDRIVTQDNGQVKMTPDPTVGDTKTEETDGPQPDRANSHRDSRHDAPTDAKLCAKISANSTVAVMPRSLTKAALRREATERDVLRKEFLELQAAVKATEFAIPFVFYDGSNTPGGIVRVKKGDFVWSFLDRSRKVGAQLGVGSQKSVNARKAWARVSVDDLILVRGTIIIPPHYDFYFFIVNKTLGPGNQLLFDISAEPGPSQALANTGGLHTKDGSASTIPDIKTLEGVADDPTFTKVVDRRWYSRNKHIYPASAWQEFNPEKNYPNEIRRDLGGNAFFFAK